MELPNPPNTWIGKLKLFLGVNHGDRPDTKRTRRDEKFRTRSICQRRNWWLDSGQTQERHQRCGSVTEGSSVRRLQCGRYERQFRRLVPISVVL